ncbi:MAG: 2-hydroxycyclohexanecarboxyl-CoA dehydrogenase [Arenicella sp.]|jgi:2-hydroxycyclohexanecarboxyl-CoA dehydrogenase
MKNSNQKRVLVLGVSEANSIGYAIAQKFIDQGARVLIAGRTESKIKQASELLGVESYVSDVRQASQLQQLVTHAVSLFGGLDVAVNCSGVPAASDIASVTEDEAHNAVNVMLIGTLFFLQKMSSVMSAGGSIVTLSSITATCPTVGNAAYLSAKAGADHLVRAAALEFGPKKIKVNSVSPGFTDATPMSQDYLKVNGLREAFEKEIPLGRLNTCGDVANAVAWLCSDDCFMSGQNLQINGGNSLTRLPSGSELAALF